VLEKLAALGRISRQLDPQQSTRKYMQDEVRDYTESFLTGLPASRTYVQDKGRQGFSNAPINDTPTDISELLAHFRQEVDTTGINPA